MFCKVIFIFAFMKLLIIEDELSLGDDVSNTPLDKDKVFRRFYQPSGRKEGATGLGLALAYSVCMNNGMDITYDFINDRHIFSIILRNSK